MKLKTSEIEGFLRAPRAAWVLLYGPDGGLVRERAERLTRLVAEDPSDPFRVAEIPAALLRDDPARLADEANALSMTGGRRVVRLRDAGDGLSELVKPLLAGPAPAALVIVEAGELAPRSTLRKLFEDAKSAAALPCYRDEAGALGSLLDEVLKPAGLAIRAEARAFLLDNLGGDRAVSRAELEKLVLYVGPDAREITFDDVVACIGDSAANSLDDVAFAIGDGDVAGLDRAVERGLQAGANPVGLLRAVARHFLRLHQAGAALAAGGSAERAIASLRPQVHFRQVERFQRQLRRWSGPMISAALNRLLETEMACKRTGTPDEALMRRTCLELARLAAAGRMAG